MTWGDLKGKQVGIPDYCMTAALWMKATLKDMYGIEANDIGWHNVRRRGESQALELELAYERVRGQQSAYRYFEGKDFTEQASIIGQDPCPMGLNAMKPTLERLMHGSLEQV